jgi:signal transduction histidine kinase
VNPYPVRLVSTGVTRAEGVTRVEPEPVRRGGPVMRELGLAVLIAAVSWVVVVLSFDSAWGLLDCSLEWIWLPLAGLVLLAMVRLKFPASAFVGAAVFFGLWPAAGGVLALTAFHAAGRVRPQRRLRITIAVAVLADVVIAVLTAQYGWTIVLAGHAVALLLCVGLPIGVQVLLGKADRLVTALRERTHYLEDNYRLADSAARLQERSRIAQEMHDQLGHRLSLISLYAGALELATAGTGATRDRAASHRAAGDEAAEDRAAGHGAARDMSAGDRASSHRAAGDDAVADGAGGYWAGGYEPTRDRAGGLWAAGDDAAEDRAGGYWAGGDEPTRDRAGGLWAPGDEATKDRGTGHWAVNDEAARQVTAGHGAAGEMASRQRGVGRGGAGDEATKDRAAGHRAVTDEDVREVTAGRGAAGEMAARHRGVGRGSVGSGVAAEGVAGAEEARLIRGTVQTAMRELRSTLGMLRSGGPAEVQWQPVEQTGTRSDLALLVAQSRAAGVPVELTWLGEDLAEVSLPVRRAAHRLVREGLTNIHRHAPGASAEVVVDHRPGRVRIEVVSGRPVTAGATPGTGLGLIGVQERVRLLGGAFCAGAVSGGGFRVLADLPLAAPATSDAPLAPVPARSGGVPERRLDHRRGIAAVLAVGVAGIPALVSVLLNGVALVVPGSSPYETAGEPVRVGMTRAEFVSLNGAEDPLVPLAAKAVETPVPAGATCLYAREWDDDDRDVILRYCFRDDRLAVVDEFPVGREG